MKTPKKILTAIKKHERRLKKVLKLTREGSRLRGTSRWVCMRDVVDFVRISKLLKQNKINTATNVYMSCLAPLPAIVANYLIRRADIVDAV